MRSIGHTKRKILGFVLVNPDCKITAIREALPEIATTTLQTSLTQLRGYGYITGRRNCYSIDDSHRESAQLLASISGSPTRELIRRYVVESPEPVRTVDLADEFALEPGTIQEHLRALLDENKLVRVRQGHTFLYSAPPDVPEAIAA